MGSWHKFARTRLRNQKHNRHQKYHHADKYLRGTLVYWTLCLKEEKLEFGAQASKTSLVTVLLVENSDSTVMCEDNSRFHGAKRSPRITNLQFGIFIAFCDSASDVYIVFRWLQSWKEKENRGKWLFSFSGTFGEENENPRKRQGDVTNSCFRFKRAKWLILRGNKHLQELKRLKNIKSIKTVELSFEFSNVWLVQCDSRESIP